MISYLGFNSQYIFKKNYSCNDIYPKCIYMKSENLRQFGNLCARKCTCKVLPSTVLPYLLFSISFSFIFRVPSSVHAFLHHYSIITLCIYLTYSPSFYNFINLRSFGNTFVALLTSSFFRLKIENLLKLNQLNYIKTSKAQQVKNVRSNPITITENNAYL